MLRKCLKHEFHATGRVMLPIYIAVLSLSVLTHFALNVLASDSKGLLNTLAGLTLALFIFGIIGACVGVVILAVKRFYASFFSDEGYLTMTLPVSTHKLIISRLLVSIVWYALTALVCIASIFVMVMKSSDWNNFLSGFGELMREIIKALPSLQSTTLTGIILLAVEILLCMVLAMTLFSLFIYAAIAVGHSFNKSKKLLSVVFAFVFYHVSQIAAVIFGAGTIDLVVKKMTQGGYSIAEQGFAPVNAGVGAGALYLVLACAVFYFVTHFFITKKLNLE